MYKYFTAEELACQHCGADGMNADFMAKVEFLREQLGFPFVVSSAYRCPDHPIEAKKTSGPGAHSTGRAIDIAVQGEKAHQLLKKAFSMGIGGIGVNQKGSGRFIHLDDLDETDNHTRPWVWSY
jgi:zinc D-Ala-D-Ala carboxypeptidase